MLESFPIAPDRWPSEGPFGHRLCPTWVGSEGGSFASPWLTRRGKAGHGKPRRPRRGPSRVSSNGQLVDRGSRWPRLPWPRQASSCWVGGLDLPALIAVDPVRSIHSGLSSARGRLNRHRKDRSERPKVLDPTRTEVFIYRIRGSVSSAEWGPHARLCDPRMNLTHSYPAIPFGDEHPY